MKLSREITVINRLGLHARPAMKLVELSQRFDASITIIDGSKQASADSVMGLLVLASAQGNRLTVVTEGAQAELAMEAVQQLIEAKFEED